MSGPAGKDDPPPKTFVIGATGFLGRHFLETYRRFYPECEGTARTPTDERMHHLDLRSPCLAPLRLRADGYQDALILAGRTKLADCEGDPERTWQVNVAGTLEIVRQLILEGIRPIVPSSDNVFDGRTGGYAEDAPLSPLNEYGRQKAELERRVGDLTKGDHLIVRLGKVFSLEHGDGTLLDEMAAVLAGGGLLRAATDQILCPVLVGDVVDAVCGLQRHRSRGVYNLCSSRPWSRYSIALELARAMGMEETRVAPIALSDLGPDPRPKSGHMLVDKLVRELGFVFTSLEACIQRTARNWKEQDA